MRKYTQYKKLSQFNERSGLDLELAILTRILGLESLHHGYWKNGQKLTLANLKKAQINYSKKIVENIPKGVKTVLDVGGGIGDVAKILAESGYKVTSVSPIKDQKEYYKKLNRNNGNKFILSKYEDLDIEEKFDLVLMAESSNYIDLDKGVEQTKNFLKNGGYFLVFGIFSKKKDGLQNRYAKESFLKAAKKAGFTLTSEERITDHTVKTLELANSYYQKYIPSLISVLSEYYQTVFSLKSRLISFFFRKELGLIKNAIDNAIPERIDPEFFKKNFTYEILLFKKD